MNDEPQEKSTTPDVTAQRVARVYAEALLNAAEKHGAGDSIVDELRSLVHDVFKADPQIETLLAGAAVGRNQRRDIITKVFKDRASDILFSFLNVLNEHDRLELLRATLVELQKLHDQRTNHQRVYVTTAVPLPDDQKNRLFQELVNNMQLTPVLETRVDPELLGGMKIRIGDLQVDATIRTELETIRSEILSRSTHEIQSRRDRFSPANGN
jgi:F-type H+-transporting ATPase subunit delta